MIQRIQSVYLASITLLTLVVIGFGFIISDYNSSVIKLTMLGVVQFASQNLSEVSQINYLNLALCLIITVVSSITIFLYRKRDLQLLMVKFLIAVVILLSASIAFYLIKSAINTGFTLIFPFILALLAILAHRGIRKDDDLVKSYDRLR